MTPSRTASQGTQRAKVEALEAIGIRHCVYKPLDAEEFVKTALKASGLV